MQAVIYQTDNDGMQVEVGRIGLSGTTAVAVKPSVAAQMVLGRPVIDYVISKELTPEDGEMFLRALPLVYSGSRLRVDIILESKDFHVKANPYHHPAGSSIGGQFAPAPGHGGATYDPNAPVGHYSGVDTTKWSMKNNISQWASKKIAKMEKLASEGKWDELSKVTYSHAKQMTLYEKGTVTAWHNLMALKGQKVQEPPKGAVEQTPGVLSNTGWKKLGGQLGTEKGGTYEGPDGKKYYVKIPDDPARAHNEVLAAKLYELAGGQVKPMHLVEIDGKTAVAGEWVESSKMNWDSPLAKEKAGEDFAIHAWLANRDAVGAGSENPMDNIRWTADHKAMTIDPGGALEFKGMGGSGKKPGFGNEASEWDALRDSSINPSAAKAFGDMTSEQLINSAAKLKTISAYDIKTIVNKYHGGSVDEKVMLTNKLLLRKQDILDKAEKLEVSSKNGEPSPSKQPPAVPSPPQITAKTMQYLQPKIDKIFEAAKSGDIAAIQQIKTIPDSDAYYQRVHQYKMAVLSALQAGGKPQTTQPQKSVQPAPKPQIDVSQFPKVPKFTSSNKANIEANNAKVQEALQHAKNGDLESLKSMQIPPSPKLKSFHDELVTNLVSQLNPPPQPKTLDADYAAIVAQIPKASPGLSKIGKWAVVHDLGGVPISIPTPKTVDTGALHKKGGESYDKLPAKDRMVLKKYTEDGYISVNGSLRTHEGKTSVGSYSRITKEAVEKASIPLPVGLELSRAYHADVKVHMSAIKPGHVLADYALLSTSTSTSKFSGIKINMIVGPNVKGLPAKKFSSHASENEVILPSSTRLMVTSVSKSGKINVVILPNM